jgi:hypothetical protein
MIGEIMARYPIVEKVGGGMDVVYKAEDTDRENQWNRK